MSQACDYHILCLNSAVTIFNGIVLSMYLFGCWQDMSYSIIKKEVPIGSSPGLFGTVGDYGILVLPWQFIEPI